ncbi:hypothetical protein SOCE26_066440 [Sorangium cellulosum]|uniref:Uncharacterized protein n=1 Tax=Sorangium cellulosum TaxID=56 RepID=A0A2L0F0U6_SORCE|nr:DUF1552 domain-containing protein [Sorangium cellulosum]AUX45163.1 hypothetical protein SOCE26_066440 [Sorangium cellulosum]
MLATGAAVTIPLPLLEIMLNESGTAYAQPNTPVSPLYVTWFFGNGTLPGRWKPARTGSGSAWELSPQLQPLAALKSHLTVITGLENKLVVPGFEHPTGSAGATTGAPLDGNAVRAASIDQVVADAISAGTPYRSLEVGLTPATPGGPQDSLHTVSHKGPHSRNNPEFDPRAVFNRLFMGGAQPDPGDDGADQAEKLAKVRRSVLDSILQDGASLKQRLGTADRQRVEQHLESIRAIERRLEATPSGGSPAACSSPAAPSAGKDVQSEAPPAVNTAMVELSALALACERTRVLSFMFSLPAAHVYYRHLASDMNDDFHDTICHGDPGDQSGQPRVDKGVIYTMRCLNEFLTKLKSTPHGSSNLLDHALVFVTSDTAWGKVHTKAEWPVLFAGKAGGRLRGDEHHNFPGENLSKALLTVAQIMGSTAREIGVDAGRVTSPLAGIQV